MKIVAAMNSGRQLVQTQNLMSPVKDSVGAAAHIYGTSQIKRNPHSNTPGAFPFPMLENTLLSGKVGEILDLE